jgi:hypothetical protein
MDSATRTDMIRILHTLMKRPGASVFMDPVVPGRDCPFDYRAIVPEPTSLKEILSTLKRNAYPSPHNCRQEIERCWSNAERYNGTDHPIGQLAGMMRREFAKLFREIDVRTVSGFCAEVHRLRNQIGRWLTHNPYAPQADGDGALSLKALPTEVELQQLATATDLLTDKHDHEDLHMILQAHQPELVSGKKIVVLTSSLRADTFRAIRSCVKSALVREGLEYPA